MFTPHPRGPKTGVRVQKYCSSSCKTLEGAYRRGEKVRKQLGVCPNGHERTPENTRRRPNSRGVITNNCLDCRRIQQAKRRTRPGVREEDNARKRAHYYENRERLRAQSKIKRSLGLWRGG